MEKIEELQRERKCRDSLLVTTDSSVDQQHGTAFCALEHARSSYKPALLMGSVFLADASSGVLGGERTGPLRLEVAGSGVRQK